jgi:hypothetical protein
LGRPIGSCETRIGDSLKSLLPKQIRLAWRPPNQNSVVKVFQG